MGLEEIVMNTMDKLLSTIFGIASNQNLQDWGYSTVQEIAQKFGMPPA